MSNKPRTEIDIYDDLNQVDFEITELVEKRRRLNQELTEYLHKDFEPRREEAEDE